MGAAAIALLLGAPPARAQTTAPDPISGTATVLRATNEYLTLVYGVDGTPAVTLVAAPDTTFGGRWGIATTGGDPTTAADDNQAAFAWNFFSMQVEPQLPGQDTLWYRVGDDQVGQYTVGPLEDTPRRSILSTWETTETVDVPTSGGTTQTQPIGLRVEERHVLMRDIVRAEYRVINIGRFTRRVRVRMFVDPVENGSWIIGRQRIETETSFDGGRVPDQWRFYVPLTSPQLTLRSILGRFGASLPNRFVIAATGPLATGPWAYVVNPSLRIDGVPDPANEACQSYYDTFVLSPGASRTFVVYCGLGVSDCDPTPPYVLAAQAPRSLGFVLGDDPDTANPEPSYPSPRTFRIRGYFYNVAEFDINNASMFITLPDGMTLTGNQSPVVSLGTILRQTEAQATWEVEVDPAVSGVLTYMVTASGTPVAAKTVSGTIEVPAQAQRSFPAGLRLMSVPFKFANPDTSVALNLPPDRIRLARWDPEVKRYAYYPENFVSTVVPGAGYWFKPDLNTTLVLKDATPVPRTLTANFVLPIRAGWNMIGAPYVYGVPWANTRVTDGQTVLSLTEAASAGWIRPTLFSYNPLSRSYEFPALQDATLEPWSGYWVRADRDCYLIIAPVSTPGASVTAPDQRAAASDWRIRLVARTRNAQDTHNFAGVSRAAPDGYDLQDIEEPPVPGEGYVSLRFVHSDWGRYSGYYTQDLRSDDFATEKVWDFEVVTDQAGEEVTLSWPQVNASLPRHLVARIEDRDTGRRVYLRTEGAYRFRATSRAPRRLRLVVSRRTGGRLAITGLEMTPVAGRAAARSISFQLSEEASATVRIISPSGRTIREVAVGRPGAPGRNSVVWDGSDAQGNRLTSGLVMVEVLATAPDGTSVQAVRPYVLTR